MTTINERELKELRAIARELNQAGWKKCRAFYFRQQKLNCARVHKGELQLGMCQRDWRTVTIQELNETPVLAL